MAESRDTLTDIHLSDQWRVHGGPRDKPAREELRDRLISLVIKAFGSVDSSLDLLLKESPRSTGNRIKTLIRAYELFSLRKAREAVEAQDPASGQRFAKFADEFRELDGSENRTTAPAEKVRALLRTDFCRLPAHHLAPAPQATSGTGRPPAERTLDLIADTGFWKQRHAEFLTDAIRFADLKAEWKAYFGTWILWWGSTPDGIRIPPEVLEALNETSGNAVTGLLGSGEIGDQEPWPLWLESMRKGEWRGFRVTGNCPVSRRVWDAGVRIGRPPVEVRRELGLSTPDEPEADHWLEDLTLDNVFRESADFCEDLARVLGLVVQDGAGGDATQQAAQARQAKAQAKRAKDRSDWLDQKRQQHKDWSSDTDIAANGGPTYNTIQRYRSGTASTRDLYVRRKIADALQCEIKDVPE